MIVIISRILCQCSLVRAYGAFSVHVFNNWLKRNLFILECHLQLSRGWPGRRLCFGPLQALIRTQCHLRIWRDVAAILAQVLSPATRMQCPNIHNKILISMQQLRIAKLQHWRNLKVSLILNMGKVIHYFPDFFDPYFYFVLNLIWVFFVYKRKLRNVSDLESSFW